MNIAEAHRLKVLETEVASFKRQVADLTRRLDDLSAAERARTDRENDTTLRLKKSG
jgi:hypothetical protein